MIEQLIQDFQAKYRHLRIDDAPVDLTACFYSHERRFIAPRSYGDLSRNAVVAYTVFGGKFVEKYVHQEGQRLCRLQGHALIKKFDLDALVMSSLCVYDLRNTSLHEVKSALRMTDAIQGFRRWHIRNIEQTVQQHHPAFDPERDSVFLFCDTPEIACQRLSLSALWFTQMIALGSDFFTTMDEREARLMERIFPAKLLAGDPREIQQRSYMYGRPIHTPESVEFLSRKVTSYRQWRNEDAHE